MPAAGIRCWNAQLIKHSPDDRIGQFLKIFGMAVKGGGCRKDNGSRLGHGDNVAGVDEIPGSLAWDKDQLAALLEENIGCAKDQIFTRSRRDAPDGTHGTRHDDHTVKESATAREGSIHRFLIMLDDSGREIQRSNLLMNHLPGVGGENEMDLMAAPPSLSEMMQEALEIDGSTGSRGCKDKAHVVVGVGSWP